MYASVNYTIMGSDNGLSPGRRLAIIWTNAGILLIAPLGTNFNEIIIEIKIFSFTNLHLKVPSAKVAAILFRPQCVKVAQLAALQRSAVTGRNRRTLECGTWYHHPRRLQCVWSRNLRILKVATWHYRCRHNLKNNCIWDNLQCCLLVSRSPSKPVMLTFDLQSRKV